MMDKRISALIDNWSKRNIIGLYCENKESAVSKILEIIPAEASAGGSGSMTLEELEILRRLEERGNKIFNQNKTGLTRQESLGLRRQGAQEAGFYLAGANAVSEEGELVFFSAFGNRTAGISYADKVIVVCGVNKIAPNLEEAIKRAREYATPLNCKRLDWNTPCRKDGVCKEKICRFPEYKRMCCQVLIIEAEAIADRFRVILVGEKLGY